MPSGKGRQFTGGGRVRPDDRSERERRADTGGLSWDLLCPRHGGRFAADGSAVGG
jgi:hypothetical protein